MKGRHPQNLVIRPRNDECINKAAAAHTYDALLEGTLLRGTGLALSEYSYVHDANGANVKSHWLGVCRSLLNAEVNPRGFSSLAGPIVQESELTLNAYSFNRYWSSEDGSLPFASNALVMDTFVSSKNIEVEQKGTDTLTVRWNEAETGSFSVDLHENLGNMIFRRLFDGIAADAEEITKLSSANQKLQFLTDSAVKKYCDLVLASAEREQLLLSRFTVLLEKSKAQQNDDRVEQSTTNISPLNVVGTADLTNSNRLVGKRLIETFAHQVSPKKARKRPPILAPGASIDVLDLNEIT
ncbi:hypothetical protein TcWFU_009801 [Taenia crassiceps]|uniref:Uncharacterized protein n=1 Tax=Taenia crassiceps TaxID=6207 RepID=A0ABR4QF60_9CEST